MQKLIKIGVKEVMFKATAATPLHYRNQFGKDLIKELTDASDEGFSSDLFMELAYIMSDAFKEGTSLVDWLEKFEPMELYDKAEEIIEVYTGNVEGISETKNAVAVESSIQQSF